VVGIGGATHQAAVKVSDLVHSRVLRMLETWRCGTCRRTYRRITFGSPRGHSSGRGRRVGLTTPGTAPHSRCWWHILRWCGRCRRREASRRDRERYRTTSLGLRPDMLGVNFLGSKDKGEGFRRPLRHFFRARARGRASCNSDTSVLPQSNLEIAPFGLVQPERRLKLLRASTSVKAGDRIRTGDVQLGKLAFYH
jgi:hypothetical protein